MFLAWRSLVCLTLTVVEHRDQRPQSGDKSDRGLGRVSRKIFK